MYVYGQNILQYTYSTYIVCIHVYARIVCICMYMSVYFKPSYRYTDIYVHIDSGQYERTVVRFSLGAVLGKLRTINLIML